MAPPPLSALPADPWHYARPALAERYLHSFGIGLTSARGLFAKRRMGKSEFLEQDLIPAAQAAGYRTAYLNLWDARAQPAQSLVAELGRTLEPEGPAKSVKSAKGPNPSLGEMLRGFDKPARRMLLVLDEAQVLADPAHADFAHSLRAGLDSRKQHVKVVLAGSSEPTLRRMFGRSTEPFYNWAPLEPFELLGTDFVKAMVAKVRKLSRYPLPEQDALQAFAALHHTPEFFRRYLNRYLTHAELGAQAALADTQAHVFDDANFRGLWNRMLPADRQMLKLIANGVTDLHSEATRLRLGRTLGTGMPVSKSTPQHALRRLQAEDIVAKLDYGDYRLQDDALAEWLRTHAPDT